MAAALVPAPQPVPARYEPGRDAGTDWSYPDPSVPDRPGVWVVCGDHAVQVCDAADGERLIAELAAASYVGACRLPHHVEHVVDYEEVTG